jgi:hypothetical protein
MPVRPTVGAKRAKPVAANSIADRCGFVLDLPNVAEPLKASPTTPPPATETLARGYVTPAS